jgi:hypothetical protein
MISGINLGYLGADLSILRCKKTLRGGSLTPLIKVSLKNTSCILISMLNDELTCIKLLPLESVFSTTEHKTVDMIVLT